MSGPDAKNPKIGSKWAKNRPFLAVFSSCRAASLLKFFVYAEPSHFFSFKSAGKISAHSDVLERLWNPDCNRQGVPPAAAV